MESTFLEKDFDVAFLANKGIVVLTLSAGTISKSLGQDQDHKISCVRSNIVLTECFSRRIMRFSTSPFDFIHSERVASSTSSFLFKCLTCTSN